MFFGLQFGYTLTQWATDRVTFTLSREGPGEGYWEAKFFRNGKPVANFEKDATPFQKISDAYGAEYFFDAEGLHTSRTDDYDALQAAFNDLSESEARSYIESYNSRHGGLGSVVALPSYLWTWIMASVLAPLWPMACEVLVIIATLFPDLFLATFGSNIASALRPSGISALSALLFVIRWIVFLRYWRT